MTVLLTFRPTTVVMWTDFTHGFRKDVNRDLITPHYCEDTTENKN
ncbi:hypothetical protein SAMN05216205_4703 [Pseudomonas mohnii]|uniref:Uncharacterized protein n=1 Tax=Pseudomonas mohnii TaxID=395600 RepID=A0ABY0YB02_9PSED|nr:hypothetical protein SAMN05216205_4703 [Pseudomonas mohnii]